MEGNRALINVQGLGITAESAVPLRPGDSVKLQITQIRPQVVLSLLSRQAPPPDPVSTRIRDLLPSRERLSVLVRDLLAELASSQSKDSPDLTDLSDALKEWVVSEEKVPSLSLPKQIHGMGIQRENHLRAALLSGAPRAVAGSDLRTLLARILSADADRQPPLEERLLSSLRRLSDNLELVKWLNSVPREKDEAQFLPLLFQFATGEWADVDLYFLKKAGDEETGEAQQEKAPPYRVVILLNLPSMGNIQIDASFSGKTLYLAFYAAESATRAKAEERGPELQAALEALGWNPRLTFNDLRREPNRSGPVQILIPKGYRLIDTRA